MSRPIDVATRETASFIANHVPPGASLLEAGCGAGDVALELQSSGYRVTGVEADEALSTLAEARGVNLVCGPWPDVDCPPVDAVAFTRSLHHIHALADSVAQARRLLRPDGVLLLEDFSYDAANRAAVDWLVATLRSEPVRAMMIPSDDELATGLLGAVDPLEEWRRDHDHDLHTWQTMVAAVEAELDVEMTRAVPYLYRYLVPVLPPSPDAAELLASIRDDEARLGASGEIHLIGRRLVASRSSG